MRTMQQIADKATQVYSELYSIEDTLKGNSLEMHEEARKIAIQVMNMQETIKQVWGGEIDHTEAPEDKLVMWDTMTKAVDAYGLEETVEAYMYWLDVSEEEARDELRG